jgi:peptidoglycan hydrolase CwlO-like protein
MLIFLYEYSIKKELFYYTREIRMKHKKNIILAIAATITTINFVECNTVTAEISYGELIDKITILGIKTEKITDEKKLKNVYRELASLQESCNELIGNREDVSYLQKILRKINEMLWDIEDKIRIKERLQEFDDEFIELARSVYITNDKRCAIKKQIDILLDSHITEEKSYAQLTHP